jgi:DNA processing protein
VINFHREFFMTHDVLTAVTHVASQVLGKWIDDPIYLEDQVSPVISRVVAKRNEHGLAGISEEDWFDILDADIESDIPSLPWLRPSLASGKINLKVLSATAYRHFMAVEEAGAESISIHSADYPPLLRYIARPPLCLTAMGNSSILSLRHISVIGSRKASYQALRMSVEVGLSLNERGVGVVSGGAIGCDIAVHEGMLSSTTEDVNAIVVFAGGLSSLFPKCNKRTFSEILDRGGVCLSERLWFQGVKPRDFPSRNRIVSGMSDSVAVMAAVERSGSLITAQEALEQGRDVHVFLPMGFEHDVRFGGSAQLVLDGAYVFSEPSQLVQSLFPPHDEIFGRILGATRVSCQGAKTIGTFETEPINYL